MSPDDHQRSEDHALLARVVTGDRVALEMLYRRHAGWLTQRLQSRCGDPELTDLAVQDTFVAVWKSAKKFRGDGDVGAWIWGIGIRRLIDQRRKRRPTPVDMAGHEQQDPRTAESIVVDALPGPATAALGQLEPDLRAVMILTAIDGLTTREAARLLGIPQGTVKTRLMRARRQLEGTLT
jgi:RNA polymerase sigma-70 factor (ECF subfamily)